jgi:hypothetical protein
MSRLRIRAEWDDSPTPWRPLPGDCDFEDNWLTTREVAALTGLTINQVGGRCARGTLPCRRIGNEYLASSWERWT